MTVYIIEYLVIVFCGILYRNKKINSHTFVKVSFASMALLLALRANSVGEDTKHFIDVFNYSQNISWGKALLSGLDVTYATVYNATLKVESGFIVLNKIIGLFTRNGQWFLAIISFATCYLFGKFIIDNSEDVFFSTYIFLCESLFMNSFNLMRQLLALSIAIQSYTLMRKKKTKWAVLTILFASCFHRTVIVWLLLILLMKVKNKKRAIKYATIGLVSINFLMPVIQNIIALLIPRYQSYFTTNYWASSIGNIVILWIIEIVICVLLYKNRIDDDNYIPIISNIFYLGFEFMGLNMTSLSRVALNFRALLLLEFPQAEVLFSDNSKKIYRIGIMAILAILYFSYANTSARLYSFFWR